METFYTFQFAATCGSWALNVDSMKEEQYSQLHLTLILDTCGEWLLFWTVQV